MVDAALQALLDAPSAWQGSVPGGRGAGPLPAHSDMVVVGGGIGGLSAALHALRRGCSVTVLEAGELGAGASGRNSGFVVPVPARHGPDTLNALLGDAAGPYARALQQAARQALSRGGPQVVRQGWLQPFAQPPLGSLRHLARQWQALGIDAECVEGQRLGALAGTRYYPEALLFKGGGGVDPLALLHQLADAVMALGGCIVEQCSALNTTVRGQGVTVHTPQGDIRAGRVLLAANAYGTGASQATRRPIGRIALGLGTFTCEDLPPETACLPFSDARKDMWFCRRLTGNRLITGAFILPGAGGAAAAAGLMSERLQALFGPGPWTPGQLWAGYVGVTRTGMPVVRQHGPRIIRWSGCNGRGIALSSLMAQRLVDHLMGEPMPTLPQATFNSALLVRWLAHSVIQRDRRRQKKAAMAQPSSFSREIIS
ncbi:FAD-binding oxidoreductase [Pseudomonas silvicola]|nr:FAD-binding oxidoreductase [Pseudomonas silvicola]